MKFIFFENFLLFADFLFSRLFLTLLHSVRIFDFLHFFANFFYFLFLFLKSDGLKRTVWEDSRETTRERVSKRRVGETLQEGVLGMGRGGKLAGEDLGKRPRGWEAVHQLGERF